MNLAKLYKKLESFPLGKTIFSLLVCFKAPYFGTISPRVRKLLPGYCEISMRKRRGVYNHIKTVHAIAMCNLCELTMGLAVEAGLPKNLRWIPKTMTTNYLLKAETDLVAKTSIVEIANWSPGDLSLGGSDRTVFVQVFDKKGQEVMNANITLWITTRKI